VCRLPAGGEVDPERETGGGAAHGGPQVFGRVLGQSEQCAEPGAGTFGAVVELDGFDDFVRKTPRRKAFRSEGGVVAAVGQGFGVDDGEAGIEPGPFDDPDGGGKAGEGESANVVQKAGREGCIGIESGERRQIVRGLGDGLRMIPDVLEGLRRKEPAWSRLTMGRCEPWRAELAAPSSFPARTGSAAAIFSSSAGEVVSAEVLSRRVASLGITGSDWASGSSDQPATGVQGFPS